MKAIVTGGAGFIGSHIVDRLLNDSHKVVVIDNFSTGHRRNLPDHKNLTIIEGDICDSNLISKQMVGTDWVFHKAAVASVPQTVNDPVGSSLVNYSATLQILESARQNNVKRVVFASSAALYGDEPTLPKAETMLPVALSPYAVDKLASEYACGMYYKLYGLNTVSLRYFNVFGPRQDPLSPYSGVISIFMDRVSNGQHPVIYGDGEQTRDFVYVSDVVNANMLAVNSNVGIGEVFNIGASEFITINNLLKEICANYSLKFDPIYKAARSGDIRYSYSNSDKARNQLGWKSHVSITDGLKAIVDSM